MWVKTHILTNPHTHTLGLRATARLVALFPHCCHSLSSLSSVQTFFRLRLYRAERFVVNSPLFFRQNGVIKALKRDDDGIFLRKAFRMPWIRMPGIEGLVYEPEATPRSRRKHPCSDCYACQWCSDAKCAACRKGSCCAASANDKKRKRSSSQREASE